MITPSLKHLSSLKNLLKMYEIAYKANNVAAIEHCAGQFLRIKAQMDGKESNPVVSKYLSRLCTVHEACQGLVRKSSSCQDHPALEAGVADALATR